MSYVVIFTRGNKSFYSLIDIVKAFILIHLRKLFGEDCAFVGKASRCFDRKNRFVEQKGWQFELLASRKYIDDSTSCGRITFEDLNRYCTLPHIRGSTSQIIKHNVCVFNWLQHWLCDDMMTSSNGNIFRVTGHLCGEFTGPRWITRTNASDAEQSFDAFFDLRPNKRLSKQSRGWWFETLSRPLWSQRNEKYVFDPAYSSIVHCDKNSVSVCQ